MWTNILKNYIQNQSQWMIGNERTSRVFYLMKEQESFNRKKEMLKERKASIVNNQTSGSIVRTAEADGKTQVDYLVHHSLLIKQGYDFYVEELVQERRSVFEDDVMLSDSPIVEEGSSTDANKIDRDTSPPDMRKGVYQRMEAVKYAERWWNTHNPAFKSFDVNCTNYVSQCINAGGIHMTNHAVRTKGWWMRNNSWSYSWSVAHAFRWFLSGSRSGLVAEEKHSASQLLPGDIVCYDFNGDGRWEHSTIVVAKDPMGEPLVNANTTNSRMRYWGYEDSTAYTKRIQYKFFHIV
ncbi:amidase domain-containing protein [Fictibacillus aquaticus]|uniref:Putative amidase domain-containing protein n=1 Tax=Fictibacillus aquaticus TaxID=2021314 RepID=A0A235F6V6_9BACL|nr:amidase domain-containing protein [Fictibacillus aquaticus]OYD56938.1 hypothetical protein CGZ90_15410 [Fictibacillus aquaticus]